MNAIQIQDLITKIGEFNLHLDLQYYFDKGEEILESEFKKVEELNSNLEDKLLIQLRENSDVELLQNFMVLADEKENALMVLYHQFRSQLADLNNTNPVNKKSIPIVCTIIDYKLDSLSTIKKDLHTKIAFFKYKISSDFSDVSSTPVSPNKEHFNSNKATFNLSKKDSLILIYLMEKAKIIKFEGDTQRNIFIETNFNYTEDRLNHGDYNKTREMKAVNSDFSKIKNPDKSEIPTLNKSRIKLCEKFQSMFEVEFQY